ncbi:MAG: phosphoglycerate mutase [Chitinivibrionales bacterium]|nr:phosphoglycerate mutase [Chitinivibrionales bacterium]
MSRFLLIRHGEYDSLGNFLAGRMDGVRLNYHGERQAAALAEPLSRMGVDAVVSSPLERAVATAVPLAEASGMVVETREQLTDIDYGEWTGKELKSLEGDADWLRFNTFRGGSVPPGGESILHVQARMVHDIFHIAELFPNGTVALFGHADPIKTVVAHFLGIPFELMGRISIAPASVTTLEIDRWGAQFRCLGASAQGISAF